MKRKIIFIIAAVLITALSLSAEVRVQEVEMEIPTYLTGPEDPNPPLWNLRVYPYPMQTDITREKTMKRYRVIVLENDYIRLLILPDIGGRILAALDKTNENFDFIYYNHVIKPGLVALRGAWLSGGIEWNFPTLGHTVNTFSPVSYKILKNDDRSVTCVVGTMEWVRRMRWEVFITLFPDRSYFKTTIRLFNRTLTHNNGYFWANAATHAEEDTRIVFPPAEYTYAGGRRNPAPWPMLNGKDVSWYKNTASAHDYFCGSAGDYNGAYNYQRDNGTVHYAPRYESPGKKFWTWGTAPSGAIWEKLLTDADGQYIEIQAGRLLTQGDTWIFDPHCVEQWEEWWYPVKKMQGFIKANPDAAINFERRDKGIWIALNTTRVFENAELRLFCGEKKIFSERLNISPRGFYGKEVEFENGSQPYRLEFLTGNGQKIIDYTTEKPKVSPPELQPDFQETEAESAEISFLKGYYSLKHWDTEGAISQFRKAIEIDPGLTPALKWLGILYYQTGRMKEALELFEKVLQRDEDDHTARYYRALARINLGISERTKEDLYLVSRRAAYRHVAPYVLAALALDEKDYQGARDLLKRSLRNNADDLKAAVMLAAAERHLGNRGEAERLVEEILKENPIDPLALLEKKLLSGRSELEILRSDPECYLEAASDYSEMNLIEDAVAVLAAYSENAGAKEYPLLYYSLGYLNDKLGQKEEAEKNFKKAAACSPDFVFPFRTETERVLGLALKYNPSDWKAIYYLGNLLTAKLRWEEGFECFKKAAEFSPKFSVLYRNLGEIYWRRVEDYGMAEKMYEKAISCAQDDYRLYVALDELYAMEREQPQRDKLFRGAPEKVKKNLNYILKRAEYYLDGGQYDKTLKILEENSFLPWEGWTGAREIYVLACLKRACSLMEERKYEKAKKDLFAAMEYPENLGTGEPPDPVFSREYFFIGLCYERMGDKKIAEDYFKKVERIQIASLSEHSYYRALALKKLGRDKESEELLLKIKSACEALIERSKSPYYFLLAARACAALGEKSRAEEYLQKAIAKDPSSRQVSLFISERRLLKM
jgi:tetratricopeptide (TPR) repeat protein